MKVTGVVSNLQANQYNARLKTKRKAAGSEPQTTQPSFKGDLGKGIGAVLGFAGAVGFMAVTGGLGIPAVAAMVIGSKAGSDLGDKVEKDLKNEP